MYQESDIVVLCPIDAVRKRPAMYVGSIGLDGFIHYLVYPMTLLLSQHPTRVAVTLGDGSYTFAADCVVPIGETPRGEITPFGAISPDCQGPSYEATVLNALSEWLRVEVASDGGTETLAFRQGRLETRQSTPDPAPHPATTLRFGPDATIFTVTDLCPAFFRSYLRRLSFLHPGMRFTLTTVGGKTDEFHAGGGLTDLFAAISAPYPILHDPITVAAEAGPLALEVVFAFHSATDRRLCCFLNNGRPTLGGTHEQGLNDSLDRIGREFLAPRSSGADRNGFVAVASIRYPEIIWHGCRKARVANPKLRKKVRELVAQSAREWIGDHPEVQRQLREIHAFDFPEAWTQ